MRLLVLIILVALPTFAQAGFVTLSGARWDAAPQTISGNERSLSGGLRYSLSGGSFESFRDQFQWNVIPSTVQFQQAVQQAFSAWTAVDPVSNYGTSLSFVPDFSTPVVTGGGFGTLSFNGAEIDLIASNAGVGALTALTTVSLTAAPVTLTSGVTNYAASATIRGADLHINNNAGAVYSLDVFRRLLTHEIGHAIGLGDVDLGGDFLDDNYSAINPVGTLTNSWTGLVNPLDPANSAGLSTYTVPSEAFAVTGVDILMESNGLGIGLSNPLSNLFPLTNDEYGMRQYLYPQLSTVPEPNALAVGLFAWCMAILRRRRSVAQ